jgi:hypothetical protein
MALEPRWAETLLGRGEAIRHCRHQTQPFGRSAWRLCEDLGALPRPRFDVGKSHSPPDEGCLVISIGIGNSWEFEDALADLGCSVHAFDPTFELFKAHVAHAYKQPRVRFYFTGLGSAGTNGSASNAGVYGALSKRLRPLDEIFRIAVEGRERSFVDVLKIDCEGCEWNAIADVAKRAPNLFAQVQYLLLELHMTPRYSLHAPAPLNALMSHLIDHHGFHLFRKPHINRGFPWARNETLPALTRAGLNPIACCLELHLMKPTPTNAFLSHAAWLARVEPGYSMQILPVAMDATLSSSTLRGSGKVGKHGIPAHHGSRQRMKQRPRAMKW